MDTKYLKVLIPKFLKRLENDGYSLEMVENNRWILRHFQKYCEGLFLAEVDVGVAGGFLKEKYDLDIDATDVTPCQCVVRKPLLALLEFARTGSYGKRCTSRVTKQGVPERFSGFYRDYTDYVQSLKLSESTMQIKLTRMRYFIDYLDHLELESMSELEMGHIYDYLADGRHSVHALKRDSYYLREALDWMHWRGTVDFSGRDTFPVVRAKVYSPVPSYYTDEEVRAVLAATETSTAAGKRDMLVLSLAIFYGLRVGDIAALKLDDIDWGNSRISIVQQKTKTPLTLPLIDEVRYPLIDYLKNSRPASDNPYVLLTRHAPITNHKGGASFHRVFTNAIKRAGIDYSGRRHGGHAMRHSIASSMLKDNVPLPAISGVLGHSDTSTTRIYLSIDEKSLVCLALEVPDVSSNS
jgi:integrase